MNHAITHLREERRRLMAGLNETRDQGEREALTREIEEVTAALVLIGSAPERMATIMAFPIRHHAAERAAMKVANG